MTNLNNAVIRRRIKAVNFGLYTDEDVRARSVLEITSHLSYDALNTPLPGGLADPRLGPTEPYVPCVTCGAVGRDCPGHAGHVELCVPCYHPLLFATSLVRLLRVRCANCHDFRVGRSSCRFVAAKLALLEAGRYAESAGLEEALARARKRLASNSADSVDGDGDDEKKSSNRRRGVSTEEAEWLESIVAECGVAAAKITMTSHERGEHRRVLKEFLAECVATKKCKNCSAYSPAVRQDAHNKIFQSPLAKKDRLSNAAEGIVLRAVTDDDDAADGDGYDSDDSRSRGDDDALNASDDADRYVPPLEAEARASRTWRARPWLCRRLFGRDPAALFVRAVAVPPPRFRPATALGSLVTEHSQTANLSRIVELNARVRDRVAGKSDAAANDEAAAARAWIALQTSVNTLYDSDKAANKLVAPLGIRQLLEKKEGVFRKHIMGKRVDHACRSVISPDPYVGTNEIGIPVRFAKKLSIPVPVTERNAEQMRRLVERGPDRHPGAVWVEEGDDGTGRPPRRVDLSRMDAEQRRAVAARLLCGDSRAPARVGRQLRNGDRMLVNRQPTLHKPGIMAHTVRILHSPTQQTIRMHYANCNTYNADFDGDEMNCHLPQNGLAQAEAAFLMDTDLQYIVPTDGSPLRGLIQDHVDGGVKLCSLDTFLERHEYQQLLMAMFDSLEGLNIVRGRVRQLPPAIRKPRELWTGKQVISTLLLHLRDGGPHRAPLSVDHGTKTPPAAFGESLLEHRVLVRDGELLRGVLDKKAFGASEFGLVHAVHEAYGPKAAGDCLNALGRLFTAWLQYYAGHSCRMEDLVLTAEADAERRRLVRAAYDRGARAAKAWADADGGRVEIREVGKDATPLRPHERAATARRIGQLLSGREGAINAANLDAYMQSKMNPLASEVIKACLPNGLAVPFPANTFSLMVTTGAKGSTVNQSQVSCALGQQALEGRRVPRLPSGRTLPSFVPFDPDPRADGFITDRFLTGVRPQEYYFHCMAGREGLVDTAVKTSRSGYLQRCLVKHLEELRVCYDATVRDAEGGVVQFLYGEDGVDPTKAAHLDCSPSTLEFLVRNRETLRHRYKALPGASVDDAAADAEIANAVREGRGDEMLREGRRARARRLSSGKEWRRGRLLEGWHEAEIVRARPDGTYDLVYVEDRKKFERVPRSVSFDHRGSVVDVPVVEPLVPDPVLSDVSRGRVGADGRCVSERVAREASAVLRDHPRVRTALDNTRADVADLLRVLAAKYSSALADPGEAVGCVAAQSVGEPSTQMTLNTFHLAGSGANVTLGIPRLREIIMTASRNLKTPTMSVPLKKDVSDRDAVRLARAFKRVTLSELVASEKGVVVRETLQQSAEGTWERAYHVSIRLQPAERMREAFGLRLEHVARVVNNDFVPKLTKLMESEFKKASVDGNTLTFHVKQSDDVGVGADDGREDETEFGFATKKAKKKQKATEEYEDETTGVEDGVMGDRFGHRKEMTTYEMDAEEQALMRSSFVAEEGDEQNDDEDDVDDDDEDQHAPTTSSAATFAAVKIDEKANAVVLHPLKVDPAAQPLLMVELVERVADVTVVRSHKGVDEAFVNEEQDGRGRCLQTAGVNFRVVWNLDSVDHHRLLSNDVWAVRCAYGVEAARRSIVEQIRGVFAVYGIEVDPRHLSLIADYMTYDGGFKPMNRVGMVSSSSGFLKMSFETTANFLVDAAMRCDRETLTSPSANIVVGQPMKHGTGAFECVMRA